MSFSLPKATPVPGPGLGESLGMGLGQGLQQSLSTFMQERKQEKEVSALEKGLDKLSPDSTAEDKFKTILSTRGVTMDTKKMILGNLVDLEKIKGTRELEFQKEQQRVEKEERGATAKIKHDRDKLVLEAEYASPEIKDYKKSLGLREETATQLSPALSSARQYQNSPSRFIKGTEASKALGDLATRAFAFYKPLFGGRLTQKEFTKSIENLAADRATPGGFEKALNIIESMVFQATNEADIFSNYISEGDSPTQARRKTLKDMRSRHSEIEDIIKGKKRIEEPESQTVQTAAPEEKKFDLDTFPSAAKYKGKLLEKDDGTNYRSDGTNWRRI